MALASVTHAPWHSLTICLELRPECNPYPDDNGNAAACALPGIAAGQQRAL